MPSRDHSHISHTRKRQFSDLPEGQVPRHSSLGTRELEFYRKVIFTDSRRRISAKIYILKNTIEYSVLIIVSNFRLITNLRERFTRDDISQRRTEEVEKNVGIPLHLDETILIPPHLISIPNCHPHNYHILSSNILCVLCLSHLFT